jgi:hypothetical protein
MRNRKMRRRTPTTPTTTQRTGLSICRSLPPLAELAQGHPSSSQAVERAPSFFTVVVIERSPHGNEGPEAPEDSPGSLLLRANERDPQGARTVAWGRISPCRAGWCRPAG